MKYIYIFEYRGDDGTQIFPFSSKRKARAAMKGLIAELEENLIENETLSIIDEKNFGSFSYEFENGSIKGQWYKEIIR